MTPAALAFVRPTPVTGEPVELTASVSLRRPAWSGFVVALLNPKSALFFGAYLPQFIDPSRPALAQAVVLGAGFVAIAICSDTAYALGAHRLGRAIASWRRSAARLTQAVAGGSLIALGLSAGLASQQRHA